MMELPYNQDLHKKISFSKPQILMSALFLAVNFSYFTMAPRILHIFNMYEPGGILIFPFTFLLSDILTEVYTYKYTRYLTWCVLITLGVFTFSAWISMKVPSVVVEYNYEDIFNLYPKLYLGVSLATFCSFFLNNAILAKLKMKMHGRKFWLRSLASTSIGHLVFSAVWVVIFHWGEIASPVIMKLIVCMYIWKMGFEIVATPLATALSNYLKKKEGIDPYDYGTNFNPFKI